ncbi:MAG: TIGR04053 family radical SAM/SPASM domain-containing protein [Candidatus Omnitrophica bacterium]|nr:TIGR04053 family radical SAM/SPASM domain-containing protein [Candidatus Omnitrophota bacterium]
MRFDFNVTPFLAIWETTHACDLACVHCRAEAVPEPDPAELSTEEGFRLIRQVKEMGTPILVFSGGDPLKRKDLPDLIRVAKSLGLRTGAIPAATPLLTREAIRGLKASGLDQIAFSLDAATAEAHDAFRRTPGVFARTLDSVREANELGLHVQINSLLNVHNTENLDPLIRLIEGLGIVFWEVFFLVPTGRGKEVPVLTAGKFEEVFEKIYDLSLRCRFVIKVTEAPHYRRFCRQKGGSLARESGPGGSIGLAPQGVNSGKGFVFVSCRGEVMPSGFLPIAAGNVRTGNLGDIYRNASLFKALRDLSLLKGKCGICEFKDLCGGSRSRAYALTGDYLAEDPCCAYEPAH